MAVALKKKVNPAKKKSGIRNFMPGEVIFNDNDVAESLYIIQKGQIRLYKPKGKGFIEIAILRSGEVIGEMAYFDEKSRRRSCSAEAITSVDLIEISFPAFAKTMSNLNPWFKTIINTLADRLRKTNDKVKELESNSVGFGSGGKVADYKFFHTIDILKLLSVLLMSLKTHGTANKNTYTMSVDRYKFYVFDIFNILEVKVEEFINLLTNEKLIEMLPDENNMMKIIRVEDINNFKSMLHFLNSERQLTDDKKSRVSFKCQTFLEHILRKLNKEKPSEDECLLQINDILTEFKSRNLPISEEDLEDAKKIGLVGDTMVDGNNVLSIQVKAKKLRSVFSALKFTNAIEKVNEVKKHAPKY
ncbi:MAG: cyclic nucleotide-binding domain-containing protein [Halobacteriovoraceae bacterium]|nr:cyclic nucleotide-binding domain-containing protein [Halobacteriovoraceae bacterium]